MPLHGAGAGGFKREFKPSPDTPGPDGIVKSDDDLVGGAGHPLDEKAPQLVTRPLVFLVESVSDPESTVSEVDPVRLMFGFLWL